MVRIINSSQEFYETINTPGVSICLFGSRPCPMCEKVEAIFDDISDTFHRDYVYLKLVIPWGKAPNDIKLIPYNLGLRYAPALCIAKNGKMINYLIEFIDKEQIMNFIKETIDKANN